MSWYLFHSNTVQSVVSVAVFPVLATVSGLLCGSMTGLHHIILISQSVLCVALYLQADVRAFFAFFPSQPSLADFSSFQVSSFSFSTFLVNILLLLQVAMYGEVTSRNPQAYS